LRKFLLEHNDWWQVRGFHNANGAFDIHRSFKYCAIVVGRGGKTRATRVNFVDGGDGSERTWCEYDTRTIGKLSPKWIVVPEIESKEELSVVEKIYEKSRSLGDRCFGDRSLSYAREFDMTIDSRHFRGRDQLEARGLVQDIYGNWLSGSWRPLNGKQQLRRLQTISGGGEANGADLIVSACGGFAVGVEDVADIFIPLYEGRMVGQFNANEKIWVSGKGRRATWRKPAVEAIGLGPQYLVKLDVFRQRAVGRGVKVGFLAVGSATNQRTMIATCLSEVACGNSVPVFALEPPEPSDVGFTSEESHLALSACLNSFVFDFVLRRRMSGNNLNYFILEECPLPAVRSFDMEIWRAVAAIACRLSFGHYRFCRELDRLGHRTLPVISSEAVLPKRLRAALDVLIAHLYGLSLDELRVVLGRSEHEQASSKSFFRVDRRFRDEERLPAQVLNLAAMKEETGIEAFLTRVNLWMDEALGDSFTCVDVSVAETAYHARVLRSLMQMDV
jgi:hypothetical protein